MLFGGGPSASPTLGFSVPHHGSLSSGGSPPYGGGSAPFGASPLGPGPMFGGLGGALAGAGGGGGAPPVLGAAAPAAAAALHTMGSGGLSLGLTGGSRGP